MGDSGGQGFLSKIISGIVGTPREQTQRQSSGKEECTSANNINTSYDNGSYGAGNTPRMQQFGGYQGQSHQPVSTPWAESSKNSQLTAEIERLRQDTNEIRRDRQREKSQLELALKIIQEKDSQINRLQEQIKRSRELQPPADKRGKSSDGSVYIISSPNVYERNDVVMGYLKRFASPASFLAPPTPTPRSNLLAASQTIKRRKEDLKTLTIPSTSTAEKLVTPDPVTESKPSETAAPKESTSSFFAGEDPTTTVPEDISDSKLPAFGAFSTDTSTAKKDTPFGLTGFGDVKDDSDAPNAFSAFKATTEDPAPLFGDSAGKATEKDDTAKEAAPAFTGFGVFGGGSADADTDKPKESSNAFSGFAIKPTAEDEEPDTPAFGGFTVPKPADDKPKDTPFSGFPSLDTSTDKPKDTLGGIGGFTGFSAPKEDITKEKEKRKLSDDDDAEDGQKAPAAPTPAFGSFGEGNAFSFASKDKEDTASAIPKISTFSEIAKEKPVEAPAASGFGFSIVNESDKKPAETTGGFKPFGAPGGAPVEIEFEDGFASNAGSVSDDEEEKKEDPPSIFAGFSFAPTTGATSTTDSGNAFSGFGVKTDEAKPSTDAATTSSTNAFGAFSTEPKTQASPFGSFGAFGGGTSTTASEPKTEIAKTPFTGFGATDSGATDSATTEKATPAFGSAFSSTQGKKEDDVIKPFGGGGGGFGAFGAAPAATSSSETTAFGGAFGAFSSTAETKATTPFANAFGGGGDATSSSASTGGFTGFGAAPPVSTDPPAVPSFGGASFSAQPPAVPPPAPSPFSFNPPAAAAPTDSAATPPTPFSFGNPAESPPKFDFGGGGTTSSTSPGEGNAPFAFTGGAPTRGTRKTVLIKQGNRFKR